MFLEPRVGKKVIFGMYVFVFASFALTQFRLSYTMKCLDSVWLGWRILWDSYGKHYSEIKLPVCIMLICLELWMKTGNTRMQFVCINISHTRDLWIYSIELSPSEARCWTSQEIPHLSCNLMVHYHVHRSQSLVPILSQMNPVHIHHIL
jgi:hypothetical protein